MHHICEKKTIELIESLPSLMMPLGNFLTWISKNPKKQYKNQDPWKFHMIFLDSPWKFHFFFYNSPDRSGISMQHVLILNNPE